MAESNLRRCTHLISLQIRRVFHSPADWHMLLGLPGRLSLVRIVIRCCAAPGQVQANHSKVHDP
jgi:hypothetical protein